MRIVHAGTNEELDVTAESMDLLWGQTSIPPYTYFVYPVIPSIVFRYTHHSYTHHVLLLCLTYMYCTLHTAHTVYTAHYTYCTCFPVSQFPKFVRC
jgi:hypothetical protein